MTNFSCKLLTISCLLFTGFCFLKSGAVLVSEDSAVGLTQVEAAVPAHIAEPCLQTTPIQEMRAGMRVLGRNPDRWDTQSVVEPDPVSWRLVSVRMEQHQPGQFVLGQLLRPLSWLRQHQAQPGAVIQLNMPELHVVGAAKVLSISACPPIDSGDGPVVLSTFKNIANNVLNIYVEGEAEPIGVTAGHPIWSEDRQAFIHSDQLQPGERLRSALGKTVRITSIEIRAGPEPVYNLEVAGEHVYSVTDSGLLVHNTGPCDLNVPGEASYAMGRNCRVSPAIGTFDKEFFKLKPMQKLDRAFEEIESAFGASYAGEIRSLLDSVPLNFQKSLEDFGQFSMKKNRASPKILLTSNFGNAKIMAATILHEVRHLRQFNKIGVTKFHAQSVIKAEIFATAPNIVQGKRLGLSDQDLGYFIDYYNHWRSMLKSSNIK